MKKNKRIITISITIVILLAVSVFAATRISDVARSTISASNVEIELLMLEEKNGSESPVSGETEIKPGDQLSRIAKVKNTGDQEAWVRLKPMVVTNGGSTPISASSEMTLGDVDESKWEKEGDFWYYNKPLAPGETSTALFETVTISDQVGTNFDGANLKVDAEGTQAKNNGSTALEADGWPSN